MALIAATRAEGGLVFFACTLVIILVRHSERRPDIARYIQKIARDRLSWLEEVREFV